MKTSEMLKDITNRNEHFKTRGVHIGTRTMSTLTELVERDQPIPAVPRDRWNFKCPTCDNPLHNKADNFCSNCGQRLERRY